MNWDPTRLPDQSDRTFVVTGATAGIGYFAAEQLAAAGAHVVLAGRSAAKLETARAAISGQVPDATTSAVVVDLASLASVDRAAAELATLPRLDGILLNGGAMDLRRGATTADGLPELLGTHVVANVALLAGVLPTLVASGETHGQSRIVHTSTGFVGRFRVSIDDASAGERTGVREYTKAKAITEVLAFELDRRLRRAGTPVASLVARPGIGVDARTPRRPGIRDEHTPSRRNPFTPFAQGKDTAAWSAVRALTDPAATGGEYYGPTGSMRGLPVPVTPADLTAKADAALVASLWNQIEALARVTLPVGVRTGG
ncbi:SDR family NAD(P)-dependent oxidoreductase [Agromyces larvae]|uniref:SDR family NAD(P)-dependent oxidoreductase n=1 Tax=Agromyces larvae TaxID=2929802 RepID=A0ABY4BYC7_9MICO|nr:SDR family NAD(P)-dependent oxidoreductase [Agromyces larvae]UOE42686.1 SDR family NAD(P)-dependent oxidoreductase [Agromyces larvae]